MVVEQSTHDHKFEGIKQATPGTWRRENSFRLHGSRTSNS